MGYSHTYIYHVVTLDRSNKSHRHPFFSYSIASSRPYICYGF